MRFSSFFPARTLCRTALAAAVAVGGLGASLQVQAATAASDIDATVVTPIAISNTSSMNFGSFSVGGTAGTIILSTANGRTPSGSVLLVNSVNSPTAAAFTVTGEGNLTFTITLPSSDTITRVSGSETMGLSLFVSDPPATSAAALSSGTRTLLVGATLSVGANQATGVYEGSFDVTVEYN